MMESWKNEFEHKRIAIWGFGREGKSSLQFIQQICPDADVTIVDSSKESLDRIQAANPLVKTVLQNDCNFHSFDCILKAPGIVVPSGEYLQSMTSQTELFLKHYGASTIGVTGTKGKSTTTTLIYTLLKEKYKIHLIGNIGVPCFEAIPYMEQGDLAAFELSCHQLEYCTYAPHVAVFLNLYEEHLDHYGTFEKYGNAKANILKYQSNKDVAIVHKDLEQYFGLIKGQKIEIGKAIIAENTTLKLHEHILDVPDCRLIGQHNFLNLAVAYYIARMYGVTDEQVVSAMKNFRPLAHRLENLGEHNGICFVNDSICTIGQACIQALSALKNVDVVLIGGMDRGIHYKELEAYLFQRKDVQVIFMYATGHRILQEMKDANFVREGLYEVENLEQAVTLAKTLVRPHHICLLSPAASSYDHFKNFEERGDVFKKLAFEQ